jgi:hypothetical protein
MLCLNTIFLSETPNLEKRFEQGRYKKLDSIAHQKNYATKMTKVYTDFTFNRGMGFYFKKIKMQLYGTPDLYYTFSVKE